MALTRGTKVGGDYFDLGEYAQANGRSLMVFRLVEFEPPEPGDFGAYKVPVIADVLVCSGAETGAVYRAERLFGAPSGPLRGVKNPKKNEHPPFPAPVHPIGAELVFAVEYVERKGSQPFVALNEPSVAEMDAVAAFYRDGAAWNATPAQPAAGATEPQPEMAGAGAPAANGRPWG
jgi:hypothetical protein